MPTDIDINFHKAAMPHAEGRVKLREPSGWVVYGCQVVEWFSKEDQTPSYLFSDRIWWFYRRVVSPRSVHLVQFPKRVSRSTDGKANLNYSYSFSSIDIHWPWKSHNQNEGIALQKAVVSRSPCCWQIYLQNWVILVGHMDRDSYSSTMVRIWTVFF